MLRVLHIVNKMSYGGIETFIMNIYRNIDRNKVQFDFAVYSDQEGDYDKEITQLGGKIYRFIDRRKNPIQYYKGWNNFLKNNRDKYIAIHMHVSSLTTILPIKLAKKYNIKNRIIHAHSTLQCGTLHKVFIFFNKIIYKKYATDLIACSTEAGNYVFGNNSFDILKNGIDAKRYNYNYDERVKIRTELKIKDEMIFVNVGRFVKLKNHLFLLRVFKKINEINPNTILILIGDGEERNAIEQNINELKLNDCVKLLGNINNVYEILQGCDIFLMPSVYEGLPLACIEAQASGIKCFISDTISKETDITGLVKFISLDLKEDEWAKFIIENCNYFRTNQYDKVVEAKYDISNTIKILMKKYSMKGI